jgi:hypothetical protein
MRTFVVFVLLLLCVPPMLGATGASETKGKAEPEKTLKLYLLAQNGGEAEMFALERMDLPATVSMFDWTKFTLKGGEVSLQTSSDFSLRSRSLISRENSGGFQVIQYKVIVLPQSAVSQAAASSLEVELTVGDCATVKGDVLYQPVRLAMMRAAQASKRASGFIRIAGLDYLGEGRFSATVELR